VSKEMPNDLDSVFKEALKARDHAYAPYSKFYVGAALKLKNGTIIKGHNIENASFGATVCAERVAIFKGISDYKKEDFEYMVLVTDSDPLAFPCGMCLQVLSEFCSKEFPIFVGNLKMIKEEKTLGELFPNSFELDH
jgi:cytidine deaminase